MCQTMRTALLLCAVAASVDVAQGVTEVVGGAVQRGYYYVKPRASGLFMEVEGASTANNANVRQWSDSSHTCQQWEIIHVGSQYYALINVYSGKALDVTSKSTASGANVAQYTDNSGTNQQWLITNLGNGYFTLTNRNSGMALDLNNCDTTRGANIQQYTSSGNTCQQFQIVSSAGVTGFASMSGSGLTTTTGGTGGTVTTVSTCSALMSAVQSSSATIVQIHNGNIDCRTSDRSQAACPISCDDGSTWYRIPVGTQTCTELGSSSDSTVTRTRNEQSVSVGSHTTIIGLGSASTVLGLSFSISSKYNVIMKNFKLTEINPALIEAGDGISVDSSHHVWIDHMTFSRISDGYIDIRSSSYVTVSYCHINGYNTDTCRDQHWYVGFAQDSIVTYSNNFWDTAAGRNPKVTGSASRVHVYNNYYKDIIYFCVSSNDGAQVLVENNYYEDSRYPHWADGGSLAASGNTYTGQSTTSGEGRSTSGSVMTDISLYSYTLASASGLPSSLPSAVGPQ